MDKMAENISTQEKWISEQNSKIEQPYNSITPLTKLITQKTIPQQQCPRWGSSLNNPDGARPPEGDLNAVDAARPNGSSRNVPDGAWISSRSNVQLQ